MRRLRPPVRYCTTSERVPCAVTWNPKPGMVSSQKIVLSAPAAAVAFAMSAGVSFIFMGRLR